MHVRVPHGTNLSRILVWSGALVLLAAGGLAYLLDAQTQRFERYFFVPLTDVVPLTLAEPLSASRHWLPDIAWAALAALFAAEALHGLHLARALRVGVIAVASTSWEALQGFGLVAGVFDPLDLVLSLLAGLMTAYAHYRFIEGSRP